MVTDESNRADTLNIHARWCSGGCSRWIATGAPSCLPYPCRCPETKANAPQFVKDYGAVTCWWRSKITGALTSRCPCWGDEREGKPADCCSWHIASPRYLDDRHAAFLALAEAGRDPGNPDAELDTGAVKAGPPAEPDPLRWDDDGEPWEDRRRRLTPYVRRWKPAELTCGHPSGTERGVHCPSCCRVFASELAASMHRRAWTDPCRDPDDVRDVDTGVHLLTLNHEGAWAVNWGANTPLWLAAKAAGQRKRAA